MTTTAQPNTSSEVPPKPQPAAMTPEQLLELMGTHGHTNKSLAELIGIHRNTVSRWLNYKVNDKGETISGTPIDAANALLIRERLKTKKK